jgi:hypothetical protein
MSVERMIHPHYQLTHGLLANEITKKTYNLTRVNDIRR